MCGKSIITTNPKNLEKVVSSLNVSEKLNSAIMTSHQAFVFVTKEIQNKKVNHVSPKPLPHLKQSFLVEEYVNNDSLGDLGMFFKKVMLSLKR